MSYNKPQLVKFGTFREMTQLFGFGGGSRGGRGRGGRDDRYDRDDRDGRGGRGHFDRRGRHWDDERGHDHNRDCDSYNDFPTTS